MQLLMQLLLLSVVFVRNGQLCTSLCATSCQYATAILCSHSLTETVLVLSLSVRGLECSFHRLIFLYVFSLLRSFAIQLAKLLFFFRTAKFYGLNFTYFYGLSFSPRFIGTPPRTDTAPIIHRRTYSFSFCLLSLQKP